MYDINQARDGIAEAEKGNKKKDETREEFDYPKGAEGQGPAGTNS